MELSDPSFKELLLKLCTDYDCKYDNYPESMWQGEALYVFYLENYHPELLDNYYATHVDNWGLLTNTEIEE